LNTLSRGLLVLAVIFLAGVGLLFWKTKFAKSEGLTRLTKEDMQLLVKDASPMALKRLKEDPELKKKELDNIKQFLSLAAEARRTGMADDANIKRELENLKVEVLAASYDQEKNKKDGTTLPRFASVTPEKIEEFYQNPENSTKFDEFVNAKVALAKEDKIIPEDKELSEEEKKQAKEYYAKTRIIVEEAKNANLDEEVKRKIELQTGIQEANYLAQRYAQKNLEEKLKVTDEEVDAYIKSHPELDVSAKKTKAEEILQRAKSGEDFGKLADEFSTDPGNKDPKTGTGKGGLYENVTIGQFMPEFEKAALALEPGQIADQLVETSYGYHIIKLESKKTEKDKDGKDKQTYTCRHILIETTIKDEKNPFAQPMAPKDKAKADLQEEKKTKLLEEISARNNIEVAEDFDIPEPSPEDLQKMQDQMMQQRPPMPENGQKIDPKQMEKLQKQMQEMQKNQGKEAPKAADNTGK
jgi:parvulin-like peptidyl-prolyl isomerase